jgi:phospholipid transport system transporter-binding protein
MFQPAELTMANAGAALRAGLQAISSGQTEIDLVKATKVDSAGVATLLAWQRAANERKQALVFRNIPPNLQSLAYLYGVDSLILEVQT